MNIKLYTHYGASDIWLNYAESLNGELYIVSIYSGSDPKRVDITDFLSDSVIAHARECMAQDYNEKD